MSKLVFKTRGVCSSQIEIDTQDDIIKNVVFSGGCSGNARGISALVGGCRISDVITKLDGLLCEGKSTSCPDQLAKALKSILDR